MPACLLEPEAETLERECDDRSANCSEQDSFERYSDVVHNELNEPNLPQSEASLSRSQKSLVGVISVIRAVLLFDLTKSSVITSTIRALVVFGIIFLFTSTPCFLG